MKTMFAVVWLVFQELLVIGPVNVCSKPSISKKIFSGIKKAVNTFSIPKKIFSKNENYCVPLRHTLVKSFNYFH